MQTALQMVPHAAQQTAAETMEKGKEKAGKEVATQVVAAVAAERHLGHVEAGTEVVGTAAEGVGKALLMALRMVMQTVLQMAQ